MEEARQHPVVNQFDAFGIFWCLLVATIGLMNGAWAVNDLKRGSARLSWYASRVDRNEDPFEFWMAVISKMVGVVVSGFMLWFGSSIFAS